MKEVRRRDFLKASVGLTGAAALSACSSLEALFSVDSGRYENEVLIIGAGLAGLTAAQEFKKRKVPYRLIEASSRLGGRVQTLNSFNAEGQFAELGAEFVDARHDFVFDLCSELNVHLDLIEERSIGPAFWFHDQLVSRKDIAKAVQPILSKLIRERLNITGDMANPARAFRRGGSPRAEELDAMSFEDILRQTSSGASPMAVEYLRRAVMVQFGVEANRQSSLHFLMALDPEVRSAGVYRVRGGTQVLTRALFERISGVIPEFFVRFETSLVSIRSSGEFYECRLKTPQGMRAVRTKNILFAVPPSALRSIEGFKDLPLDPSLKEAVAGWNMGTHSKAILSFKDRFWNSRDEGAGSGSMLGTFQSQSVWDSSRGQPGKSGLLSLTMAGKEGTLAGAEFPRTALRDLELVWKKAERSCDGRSVVRNWAREQGLGGSVTVFEPGRFMKWNGIFEDQGPDPRLAFAGEHVSSAFSGTLQGAIGSARKAATLMARRMGR